PAAAPLIGPLRVSVPVVLATPMRSTAPAWLTVIGPVHSAAAAPGARVITPVLARPVPVIFSGMPTTRTPLPSWILAAMALVPTVTPLLVPSAWLFRTRRMLLAVAVLVTVPVKVLALVSTHTPAPVLTIEVAPPGPSAICG